ncbi:MAG TPA: hypothetical protein VE131_09775 [Terriglobales bacterium]|nr:hypothetical protein [Terriglobales bacterium]
MNETKMPSSDDTLLIEGARSYLKASNALLYYQQEVQRKCRDVMEAYLGEYASALGVGLKPGDIVVKAWPKTTEWDGTYASLGAMIEKERVIPGISWWGTYCTLEWESEEPTFYCWIGEWFPTRKMAADLGDRFRRLDAKIEAYEKEVGISTALRPEEAATFDQALEALSRQWIKLWKKVGGMKKVFKE